MSENIFPCPVCKRSIKAPDDLAGQLIECPHCSETIEAPKAKSATPEYSVVPFVAVIPYGKGADEAATQLQTLIDSYSRNGWEFVRLESIETYIHGDKGCFGFGATPPRNTVYSMAVFKR